MQFREARDHVAGVPHMTRKQARTVYDFVIEHRCTRVLELGFAHGVSSVYFAAALDELGGDARLTTIDRKQARTREPSILDLLDRSGLSDRVEVVFSETSYTWDLMKLLEADATPRFDFAYIDGSHRWDPDGFAFLLVDRLLAPGGWVLFDDLDWTLDSSPSLKAADWVLALPEEQRTTAQVRKIFDLLVRTHPDYTDFRDEDGWGWARKRRLESAAPATSARPKRRLLGR